jgi:membrane-associated phospholipid phosphatase
LGKLASLSLPPFSQRLSAFSTLAVWVGAAFFSVYPGANWFASLRPAPQKLYLRAELALPFVPQFIWLYLSMYLLFLLPVFFMRPDQLRLLAKRLIVATLIAGICFLLIPAKLGFVRELPDAVFYRSIFDQMFRIDHPFNLVPSLHVIYSTTIMLAIIENARTWLKPLLAVWLTLILASTLLVHQHHVLDVISGLLVSISMQLFLRKKKCYPG